MSENLKTLLTLLEKDFSVPDLKEIQQKLIIRETLGFKKYQTTLDRTDKAVSFFIEMGEEEILDSLQYYTRAGKFQTVRSLAKIWLDTKQEKDFLESRETWRQL